MDLAAVFGSGAGEEPLLEADETEGSRRPDGATEHPARVGMEAGRNVDGQDRGALGIDRLDGRGPVPGQGALQPDAQQGIDNQLRVPGQLAKGLAIAPRLAPGLAHLGRFRTLMSLIPELEDPHLQAIPPGEACHHVPITAIVTRPAQHRQPPGPGPALAQQVISGLTGPLHQFRPGAMTGDGRLIEGPHLGGGIEGIGELLAMGDRPGRHDLG